MVSINYAFREVSCKIVYYGPGLSGKTTNLQYVHKKVPTQVRGELISLATDTDRTLFFDFLPLNLGAIQGFSTKFQLYTVPGQVFYNATRKLVLRGVDGLVFVADSQLSKMEENKESLNNLLENLKSYGYQIEEIPMILQYNKRDLPEMATIEQLQDALNHWNVPYYEAVAFKGIGVFDTLKGICKLVIENLKSKTQISPQPVAAAGPVPEPAAVPRATPIAPLSREIDTTEVIPSQVRQRLEPVGTMVSAPGPAAAEPKISPSMTQPKFERAPEFRPRFKPEITAPKPKPTPAELQWKPVIGRPERPAAKEAPKPKKKNWLFRFIKYLFGA
jgi:hypothetical protein